MKTFRTTPLSPKTITARRIVRNYTLRQKIMIFLTSTGPVLKY